MTRAEVNEDHSVTVCVPVSVSVCVWSSGPRDNCAHVNTAERVT